VTAISPGAPAARRNALARRIRLVVAATITWNVLEGVVALTAGTLSSSAALTGFGLDSVVEVSSAAAVAWQFSVRDHDARQAREKATLRVIALSFFALAVYVTAEAARTCAHQMTTRTSSPSPSRLPGSSAGPGSQDSSTSTGRQHENPGQHRQPSFRPLHAHRTGQGIRPLQADFGSAANEDTYLPPHIEVRREVRVP